MSRQMARLNESTDKDSQTFGESSRSPVLRGRGGTGLRRQRPILNPFAVAVKGVAKSYFWRENKDTANPGSKGHLQG